MDDVEIVAKRACPSCHGSKRDEEGNLCPECLGTGSLAIDLSIEALQKLLLKETLERSPGAG